MTERNNMRDIPTINAVDGFNPAEFTRKLANEDGTMSLYLDVKYRLLWFRLRKPNGKIRSEIMHVDDKSAVVCCKLYDDKADPDDQYVASSCAQRFFSSEKFGDRYLEIAETAAMGRVLAAAGYGTQFCGATDMFSDVIADAPVELSPDDAEGPIEEVPPVQSKPITKPAPAPAPQPQAPERKVPTQQNATLEDLLNTMTLEDAKNVIVDVGRYAGNTLGEIAMRKPSDLEWYAKNYYGRNTALKAGAILLVRAASEKAS